MESSFLDEVAELVASSAQASAVQEENEELRVRLETVGARAGALWDEVAALRDELETRLARLELARAEVSEITPALIERTRAAECAVYEDGWNEIRAVLKGLESQCMQGSASSSSFPGPDAMELEWTRRSVAKHLAILRNQQSNEKQEHNEVDHNDEDAPPVAPRPVWEEEEVPPNQQAPSAAPAATRASIEIVTKHLTFEDSTRALQLTVTSFKFPPHLADRELACLILLDGRRREQLLIGGPRKSVAPPQPVQFQRWGGQNSSIALNVVANGKVVAESELLPIRNLVAQKETKVLVGGGQIVIRAEVVPVPLPELQAIKVLSGPSEKKKRGGAHVSVPRFVKKLQSLRSLRDAYNKGSINGDHARTVEEEYSKPLPNLNWIHEQILGGWDGGSSVPAVNASGQTVLHVMAMVGSPKALHVLLRRKNKWDPHQKDSNGWSPFLYLVARQDVEGVQTLLRNGARANDSVWGVSSMHLAALSGNLDLVKLLLEHDQTLISAVDDRFATPLHYAAYGHRVAVAEFLISARANVAALDRDEHSPLLTAILRKSVPVARLLVQRRAPVSHKELWAACASEEMLTMLSETVDLREALIQRASPFGHTVLMKSVMYLSDLDCCAVLPSLLRIPGISPDDVDDNRRTALSYACLFGKPNVMKLLIASGSDLKLKDMFGNTYAHLITTAVAFDVLVEELGFDGISDMLKIENLFGWTPLTIARSIHAIEVASTMLAYKAPSAGPTAASLVPSWKYRLNVPYLEGAPNDEMLV